MNVRHCFISFIFICLLSISAYAEESTWKQADEAYRAGEKATTIAERTEDFNKALTLYAQVEQKYDGNGMLYFNIGNSYFQLGEYSWAILYYYRALALNPRDVLIESNLQAAQRKLGLNDIEKKSVFDWLFFFHTKFSLPERLNALFILGLLLLIFTSFYIWNPQRWVMRVIILSACLWLITLLSVGYSRYFSPLEGIVVKPTVLYRDAGEQYPKVSDQPILSGSKLQVLDSTPEGKWLKVHSPQGEIGYLSASSFRII